MTISSQFPLLTKSNHVITSPKDQSYNCIAWSLKFNACWFWPSAFPAYWPIPHNGQATLATFSAMYAHYGYTLTASFTYQPNFARIAVYVLNGKITHAAYQVNEVMWASKLGSEEDILHELHALDGPTYGQPLHFFEKLV